MSPVTMERTSATQVLPVLVRDVTPDDLAEMRAMLERSSGETRYRRFMVPMPRIGDGLLRRLTAAGSGVVAVALDGRIVGAAHFGELDGAAEIAVLVEDDWQRQGVGRTLIREVSRQAQAAGFRTATGCILRENRAANRFLDATAPGVRNVYDGPYRTFFADLGLIGL